MALTRKEKKIPDKLFEAIFTRKTLMALAFCLLLFPPHLKAQAPPRHPSPDWTPPGNRANYPGYEMREQKKQNHPTWQRNTNRPGGNTRGGGTTNYYDYRSISEQTGKMENRRAEKIIP
ncbi:hypothetical protein OOT00_06465 [Desulfobotulus sp. H1]|uniref:Uncharacterized protein n=1 Tax=Desulfobotulus pelophilus TaxID=2823377 RepID=A0ABT3N842_9BACT|nr:hypothetical protein [Desulfobotulus pelophilus]MCW7753627.1 hypothetical protein [Desulfobotulus pelophilus]